MLDTTPQPRAQRSTGAAQVALERAGGRVRLRALRQSGSAKAMLPGVHGAAPEVVFLNTSGGLTGGDTLSYALDVGPGLRAVATTQAAERAYAAPDGPAHVNVRLSAADGAALDWLPQETILFDRANLARRTEIALTGTARALMAETVVLGRAARGETVTQLALDDARLIRRDGRRCHAETLRLDDAGLARAGGPALLGGARAVCTLVLAAPGAEDAVVPLRRALASADGVTAAASGWDGRCVARIAAADAWPLRRALLGALAVLRDAPPPRVWQA